MSDGKSGFNAHDKTVGKDEWFTPKAITDAIGPFDLDPCTAKTRPWEIAPKVYTIEDNGLKSPWEGFVYCNPPYGDQTKLWYAKMAEHNHGIMLIFARTETGMFFDSVWGKASSIFCIKRRLAFFERACSTCGRGGSIHFGKNPPAHEYAPDNKFVEGEASAGSPSVLVGYGALADERLGSITGIDGFFVRLTRTKRNTLL